MSTIGSVTLRLEAQHEALTAGLGKGEKSVKSFGESARGVMDGLKEGLGIGLGIEVVTKSFEIATEAIHHAAEAVKEWVSESMKGQQASFRTAETLHLHVDALEGLQAAGRKAGIDSESFAAALEKTNHKIGEAAVKGGEAGEAFAKLGLDARKLAGQSLDKSIKDMADALAKVKNPAEQAAAAGELFGDKLGPKLLPLLQQGSAGIDEIIAKAKESGVALSDIDAAKVVAAQRGLDELGERAEGAKNQLTVALAPAIIAIGNKVLGLLPPAEKMKAGFTTAFQDIVLFGAAAADTIGHMLAPVLRLTAELAHLQSIVTFGDTSKFFQDAADAANKAADGLSNSDLTSKAAKMLEGISNEAEKTGKKLAENLGKPIGDLGPQVNESAKKIEEILKHLTEQAATGNGKPKELFDLANMHASNAQIEQAKKLLDQINQQKIHIEVDKSLGEMAKEIATFGMDAGKKKLFDLEAMGANAEQLKLAKMYSDQLDKLEAKKKEQGEADELIKKQIGENPFAKYQDELSKLDKLHNDGLLNAQQYAQGVADANKEMGKSFKNLTEDRKVEAQTRRMDFKGPAKGPPKADGMKQLAQQQKQLVESAKKQEFYQEQLWQFGMNSNQDQYVAVTV